ncbi:MAG: hypothetical protein ACXADY_08820 [Candidatus Hodarchaeales archaeon]
MLIKLFRGIVIAILSSIIITFVIFIFTPLLPLNVFEGLLGILFFLVVIGLSFIVYIILPPESSSEDSSSQIPMVNHSQNIDSSD